MRGLRALVDARYAWIGSLHGASSGARQVQIKELVVAGTGAKTLWLALGCGMLAAGACAPAGGYSQALDRWQTQGERQAGGVDGNASGGASIEKGGEGGTDHVQWVHLPADAGLREYVAYALAHHPELRSAFYEWEAALERVPQARALPDPEVGYAYFVRESMTQQTASLSQMFPWYGRLKAQGDAAVAGAVAAEHRFQAQRLEVVAGVKRAYAEYAHLGRALEVMEQNRSIAAELAEAVQGRFEAGQAAYADVVRAQVAVERVDDEIAQLRARRPALSAGLSAAIGKGRGAVLDWPASEGALDARVDVDERDLFAALATGSPELAALDQRSAQQRHLHRAARQNRVPDLMLGVEYMDMVTMRDQVALMGSINLPIWGGRLEAERAEALADFGAATWQRVAREQELQAELQGAYYRFADADRRAELFAHRLIPMARESLEATQAAYGAGQVEFSALNDAQRELQEMQLVYERARADRFQEQAELERIVGGELEASTDGDGRNDEPDADGQ